MKNLKTKILISVLVSAALAVPAVFFGFDSFWNWIIYISVAAGLVDYIFGIGGHWVCFIFSIISYVAYIPFAL